MRQRERNEETEAYSYTVTVHESVDIRQICSSLTPVVIFLRLKKIVIFKNSEIIILCLDSHPL